MRLLLLSLYQEVGSLCQVEQTQEDQQELKKTLVMVSIKKWAGRADTGGPAGTEINIRHGLYQELSKTIYISLPSLCFDLQITTN